MERGIVLVGLNHRTAPVEVRERVAFANGRLEPSLGRLMAVEGVAEGAILSTCNRVEVLACGSDPAALGAALPGFLAREHGVPEPALAGHLYTHTDRDAVRHLFRVAASLDSMVVGEPQILGQLKEQYAAAAAAGASGQILHRCFHRSFSVAKRIRRETAVAEKAVSIGSAAVQLSRGIFDRLADKSALPLRAGTMGELTARQLLPPGVGSLEGVVAQNRGAREREAVKAETIVDAEVDTFWSWFTSLDVVPTIVALRERMEAIRRHEVERSLAALGALDPRQREALERLTQAIVNKVLHAPLTTLRRHRTDPAEAFYVEAARRLFRLGTGATDGPPGELDDPDDEDA